jgi:hypothetical protein
MKIIESFAIYRCTQCDKFHISDMDFESVFQSHSQFQDSHGIVTNYRLNNKIDLAMFAATALFCAGLSLFGIFRLVSAWPNKPEWRFPFGVTAGLWFSVLWLIFVQDQDFGPNPWREDWHVLKDARWLWNSGVAAALTFLGAGVLLVELVLRGTPKTLLDWVLLAGCIILAEAFVLMKVFAKDIPYSEIQKGSWISLSLFVWAIIAFGMWAGRAKEPWGKVPWDKAVANALAIVMAFAVFSLLLVGIIKAKRYCAQWLLLRRMRGW